jgi:hypothetical protein
MLDSYSETVSSPIQVINAMINDFKTKLIPMMMKEIPVPRLVEKDLSPK